jgi:hypothetical protein
MTFSELKRATGIESSGLLSFHLGKLVHLVAEESDGTYTPTDQGREALRMIQITTQGTEQTIKVRTSGRRMYLVVTALVLVCLVALGSFAIYQQQQLGALNRNEASSPAKNTLVYGTLTANDRMAGIIPNTNSWKVSFIESDFHCLQNQVFWQKCATNKTYVANVSFQGQTAFYWVVIPGNNSYVMKASFESNFTCTTNCQTILDYYTLLHNDYAVIANGTATTCSSAGCACSFSSSAPNSSATNFNATLQLFNVNCFRLAPCVLSGCVGEIAVKPGTTLNTMQAFGECAGSILQPNSTETFRFDAYC